MIIKILITILENFRSETIRLENNFISIIIQFREITDILSGLKEINEPILLKNKNLIIEGGSEILLNNRAYIHIKNGCLIINKKKNKKTLIFFKKNNSNGIFVENCQDETIIENTIFKNLSFFKNNQYFLTGGINFYKTNLKIDNVIFPIYLLKMPLLL